MKRKILFLAANPKDTFPSQILSFPLVIKEGLLRIIFGGKALFGEPFRNLVKSQSDLQHLDALLDALPEILKGYRESPQSVAFSPDGQMLGVGSEDQTIYLWKLQVCGKLMVIPKPLN